MVFFSLVIFFFFSNLIPNENHLRYHAIYVTKKIPWKTRGGQRSFLADHVRGCCMRTEQYFQRSFAIPSTILETTAAG